MQSQNRFSLDKVIDNRNVEQLFLKQSTYIAIFFSICAQSALFTQEPLCIPYFSDSMAHRIVRRIKQNRKLKDFKYPLYSEKYGT